MNAAPDMLAAGLKMLAALGVVLAMILFLLYGVKKLSAHRLGGGGGKQIHVLENHYLGVKKSISLVRIPGKVLVLGISADRINLLDTLDADVVSQPTPADRPSAFGPLLNDHLRKIGGRFKAKETR